MSTDCTGSAQTDEMNSRWFSVQGPAIKQRFNHGFVLMKKQTKNKGPSVVPKKEKPSQVRKGLSRAGQVQEIFNPNTRGKSVQEQNQAARVAAKGQVMRTPESKGHDKLLSWARLLSNPFVGVNTVKCPMNFNPSPSLLSQRVTLVDSHADLKVTASTARQMSYWPGHNVIATPAVGVGAALTGGTGLAYLADMDEVAYHGRFQTIGGTNYAVGPMTSPGGALTNRLPISAHLSADPSGVGVGGVVPNTAAGIGSTWDDPLPFIADPTVAGHSRWKMIAMGVRIRNKTPVGSRGGSIVTVQPANVIGVGNYTLQSEFDRDPSYRIWGDGTDEVSVSWIPRTRDLAYWHMSTATNITLGTDTASTALEGPAIIVWFNAPAADQFYVVEAFAHFELSGNYVQQFSSQSHSMRIPPAPVQQALGAHIQNSPSAEGIQHTIAAAVGAKAGDAGSAFMGLAHEAVKMGANAAVQAVKAAF